MRQLLEKKQDPSWDWFRFQNRLYRARVSVQRSFIVFRVK